MPARLLSDMFRLTDTQCAALIRCNDPDIARLFDAAVINDNPSALAEIVADTSYSATGGTIRDELVDKGSSAALEQLRAVFENIPPDLRVSYHWRDVP